MLIVDRTWWLIAELQSLVEAGGPTENDYSALSIVLKNLYDIMFDGSEGLSIRKGDSQKLDEFLHTHHEIFCSTSSMQGFARAKPHGYAGDFELIEKIYRKNVSISPCVERWDRFFHSSDGAAAVRLRAKVLCSQLSNCDAKNILSVGCGPGLDVSLALGEHNNLEHVTLLDNDAQALRRSIINTKMYSENGIRIDVECKNALRFKPNKKYDIVWSAGLMDYFQDKTAVFLLRRMKEMLSPGGRIVVGNFSRHDTDRAYMESIMEWFLIYRTKDRLQEMAVESGFRNNDVEIISDQTGVNLFICARNRS